uniref:Ribonuclease Z n=1 Tax=Lophocladia kuetzingii TaxID=675577 RepID=A0A1Z1MNA1_9FLOR|nr:ribonuclease Z [Lophocladia kuetzingii]ARW67563.1 ribonuclease Z [Lophocladia kuetzingii]
MLFRYLNIGNYFIQKSNLSFVIKLAVLRDIWIFNTIEGCQSSISYHSLKINNISKIIITSLHIKNISGLLGLLSSLNLIGRTKALHIYGPIELKYYLDLGKRYSRTNFNYIVYLHVLKTGLVINHHNCRIYTFQSLNQYSFIISRSESCGTFILDKVKKNNFRSGPLYGKFKQGFNFLLPDGLVIDGYKFTSINILGSQKCLFNSAFYNRYFLESNINAKVMLFS